MDAINTFLASILSGINSIVHSYGWSIVVFTVLIKFILLPLDLKSRKSMRRMSALQPQITKLQKKYANDKEKLNQKTAELYRTQRINPLSGCLPMLLSFPVLIAMFGAMRMVANVELAKQVIDLILPPHAQINEGWLWVKNLWMPDSPFSAVIVDQASLTQITQDIWNKVFAALTPEQVSGLASLQITASNIDSTVIFTALQNSPSYAQEMLHWSTMPYVDLFFTKLYIFANNNGFFILPILAAVTQFLMTLTQPQTTTNVSATGTSAAGTGKFMKWFFPIFSLYICSSYNAGFSIYWVMSNLVAWGQGLVVNKIMDAQEKQKGSLEAVGEESLK